MSSLILYMLSVPLLVAADLFWLGYLAKDFYRGEIGHLLGPVKWAPAAIFYLVFTLGLFVFAVMPALEKQSFSYALLYGALFGFFTYATYDLTNFATLRGWTLALTLVDILWGAALSGCLAAISFYLGRYFF